jgi:tetratricopeptide (TPR) repeat protein
MRQIRHFYIPWVTLFFCFMFFPPALAKEELSIFVKKIVPSTVVVLTYDKDGKILGQGGGFFISQSGHIITSKHVLAGANSAEVKTMDAKESSDSAKELYEKGLAFVFADDCEKASPHFEKAVKNELNNAEAHFYIGKCSSALGRHTEAIDAYQQAIRIKPDFAEAYVNLGVVYGKLGRRTEAIDAYQQAIRIKPDFAEAHYNLGTVYDSLERRTEAIGAYQQAIRIKPDFAEAHDNLAGSYMQLRRYTEAIDAYQQAIRIKPDDADVHIDLGVVYVILGDKDSALDQYKIIKTLDPKKANELFKLIYK